jgi:hypothetical protein
MTAFSLAGGLDYSMAEKVGCCSAPQILLSVALVLLREHQRHMQPLRRRRKQWNNTESFS